MKVNNLRIGYAAVSAGTMDTIEDMLFVNAKGDQTCYIDVAEAVEYGAIGDAAFDRMIKEANEQGAELLQVFC